MRTFPLDSASITVSEHMERYNEMRRCYDSLARQAAKHFADVFNQLFSSMDQLHKKPTRYCTTAWRHPLNRPFET